MRIKQTLPTIVFTILLSLCAAMPNADADTARKGTGTEPRYGYPSGVASQPQDAGLFSKLKAWFPFGLQLFKWDTGNDSAAQATPLAAADCFQASNCLGMGNLKDYVAAAHASRNLGIPFEKLQTKIAGGKTLLQAIQELRPGADYSAAVRQAEEQAAKQIKQMKS